MTADEKQAYAKIIGPGWQYYMTKPKIVLGRGGEDVGCDVHVSNATAVSRQHFSIRFAPEHQAIEVENIGKNGILVNNTFLSKYSAPILLRSQAEIAFGGYDPMRVTLVLPVANRVIGKNQKKNSSTRSNKFVPLLNWVGETLVDTDALSMDQIVARLRNSHRSALRFLDDRVLANSVRHIISQNDHFFSVVKNTVGKGTLAVSPVLGPKFTLRENARGRFIQFAKLSFAENATKTPAAEPM